MLRLLRADSTQPPGVIVYQAGATTYAYVAYKCMAWDPCGVLRHSISPHQIEHLFVDLDLVPDECKIM